MKLQLRRPTLETRFHIDWDWFERHGIDPESIIRSQLSDDLRASLANQPVEIVDHVDPESGEVIQIDSLRETIMADCQWRPDYLNTDLPLSQALLRIFLANNNQPLTAVAIAQRLGRHDPEAILRLLTSSGVQSGVVPVRS